MNTSYVFREAPDLISFAQEDRSDQIAVHPHRIADDHGHILGVIVSGIATEAKFVLSARGRKNALGPRMLLSQNHRASDAAPHAHNHWCRLGSNVRRGTRKFVALLVSIMMLLTLGSQVFDAKALAHGLDHDRHEGTTLNGHVHFNDFDIGDAPAPEPLSDAEHKLLHSIGGLQPPLVSSFADGVRLRTAGVTPQLSRSFSLRIIDQDPPFRPPQSSSC